MDERLAAAVARFEEQRKRGMGAHLFWYVPVCMVVAVAVIIPSSLLAYENCQTLFHRFTWGILFSPSSYIFGAATVSSIAVPIFILKGIPKTFLESQARFTAVAIGIVMIVLWSAAFQIVIWGAYPLGYDKYGNGHLRLIPFIPWPTESLLHWLFG